jgi:hypothetical protein
MPPLANNCRKGQKDPICILDVSLYKQANSSCHRPSGYTILIIELNMKRRHTTYYSGALKSNRDTLNSEVLFFPKDKLNIIIETHS